MRLDKFTVKSQEAIAEAQKKAEELGHQALENEHLLYALLQEKEGTVRASWKSLALARTRWSPMSRASWPAARSIRARAARSTWAPA